DMSHDLASMVGDRRLVAYTSLLDAVDRIDDSVDGDAFFVQLAAHALETVPFDGFSIWRYDAADQMLRQVVWHSPMTLHEELAPEVPVDFGPAGRVLLTQQPITLRLGQAPAPPVVVQLNRAGFRVMCVVPASTTKVHWGVLGIASTDVDEYSPDTIDTLKKIAERVARASGGLTHIGPAPAVAPLPSGDRTQLLLRLNNAGEEDASGGHVPDRLTTISRLLREAIPHHYASLSIWDEAEQGLRRWAAVQPG